tara:strand:+ start:392 stop:670 length:279 start_codon:yes stop_codon:yes gene_type:complete
MIYPNHGIIQIDLKQERPPTTIGLLEGATAGEKEKEGGAEEAEEDVVLCIVQPRLDRLDRPPLVEEVPSIVAEHKQVPPKPVQSEKIPNCTD